MKLHKWSDALAKSKLSAERRARIQADVEHDLLEINLREPLQAAGATPADASGAVQAVVSRAKSRYDQ
jgi:hypothetical protein